ncbi:MAG TPA: hypothetical protein GX711_06635 [Clostridia bacterium]|nr:hypothetical protein [Clostridia bacterium]
MRTKRDNRLNDLSGSQWLYWTDTIYLTNFPPDITHSLRKRHGAMKPPELMAEIISFFTKKGELVLDPFAGVGGTLLGACLAERRALGYEINPRWVEIYRSLQQDFIMRDGAFYSREEERGVEINATMLLGDCLTLMSSLEEQSIDAVITDPPYGCLHRVKSFHEETNFNMFNVQEEKDFANAPDLESFLELIFRFGQEAWRVLKDRKYLVVMVGDRFIQGEYLPLGFHVGERLRQVGFKLKGLKIWSNTATRRRLKPYAVYLSFVSNITHQNILILKKEA